MKKLSLILSMAFFLNANGQDIAKRLQDKIWYATGNILISEQTILRSNKPSISKSELQFINDGYMKMKTGGANDFTFVCRYQIIKDMIKIYYTSKIQSPEGPPTEEQISHHFKIKTLPNGKDFEFIPIAAEDFE